MPRKPEKMLDPAWQAERRKSRHRVRSAITIRMPTDLRDACRQAAAREGRTVQDWGYRALLRALEERRGTESRE